jgi:methylthioribose-1-phosphate isomerase
MQVRGAPLIGVTAAYGVALALKDGAGDAPCSMPATRWPRRGPTAVNLHWALARMQRVLQPLPVAGDRAAAWAKRAPLPPRTPPPTAPSAPTACPHEADRQGERSTS